MPPPPPHQHSVAQQITAIGKQVSSIKVPSRSDILSSARHLSGFLCNVSESIAFLDPSLSHPAILTALFGHAGATLPELRETYDAERQRRTDAQLTEPVTFSDMVPLWLARIGAGGGTQRVRLTQLFELYLGHPGFHSVQQFLSEFNLRLSLISPPLPDHVAAMILLSALPRKISNHLYSNDRDERSTKTVLGVSVALRSYMETHHAHVTLMESSEFIKYMASAFGALGPRAAFDLDHPLPVTKGSPVRGQWRTSASRPLTPVNQSRPPSSPGRRRCFICKAVDHTDHNCPYDDASRRPHEARARAPWRTRDHHAANPRVTGPPGSPSAGANSPPPPARPPSAQPPQSTSSSHTHQFQHNRAASPLAYSSRHPAHEKATNARSSGATRTLLAAISDSEEADPESAFIGHA